MSKKKNSKTHREEASPNAAGATAAENDGAERKSREFSKAVEEKAAELAREEKRLGEFVKAVAEKSEQLVRDTKSRVRDASAGRRAELVRASLSAGAAAKYIFIIAVVGGVSLAGIVMCVLNITRGKYFFSAYYLIAALLGISIVIVKVNALFPTFVACDGKNLVLHSYDNNVVPYRIYGKAAFLSDFIPARLKTANLPADKIASIIIGTKNYIKRHCGEDEVFLTEMEKIEKSNIGKNTLLAMDMIYFSLTDGKSAFMSIDRFDSEDIAAVVRECMKASPDMQMLCNNKRLRSKILFDLPSK